MKKRVKKTRYKSVKTNPSLWKRIVSKFKSSKKYGGMGWNARKAQLAVQEYKSLGGSYKGKKSIKNSLVKWTKQDWQYSSKKSKGKGRYLPKSVWEKLSPEEKTKENKKKYLANKKSKKKAKYSKKTAKLVKKAK
jgi:hypothetical protein